MTIRKAMGFPDTSVVNRIHLQCKRPGFDPSVGKIPWRRERLATPVFWPREFHGLYIVHGVAKSQIGLSDFDFPCQSTLIVRQTCLIPAHAVSIIPFSIQAFQSSSSLYFQEPNKGSFFILHQ